MNDVVYRESDFKTNTLDLTLKLPENLFLPEPACYQRSSVKSIIEDIIYDAQENNLLINVSSTFFHMGLKEQEIKLENNTIEKRFTGEVYLRFIDPILVNILLGLTEDGKVVYEIKEEIKKKSWAANYNTQIITKKIPIPTFKPSVKYKNENNESIECQLVFSRTIVDRNKYDEKKGIRYYQSPDVLLTSVLPYNTTIDDVMFLIEDVSISFEKDGVKYPHAEFISPTLYDLKAAYPKGIFLKCHIPNLSLEEAHVYIENNYDDLKKIYQKIRIKFCPDSCEAAFVKQILHRNEIEGKGEQLNKTFDVFFYRETTHSEKVGNFMKRTFRKK
jgi:hypothetical protein